MSDKIDINFILSTILDYVQCNPRDFTYIGIGSIPHTPLDKLTDRWDQLIPTFVQEILDNTDNTVRIINIDPEFNGRMDFMMDYYKSGRWSTNYKLDFEYDNSEGMHIWRTKDHRVESIIISANFTHTNRWDENTNDWFLEKMVESNIKNNTKLIVQEFTGFELDDLRKHLFRSCSNQNIFKNKILIDITNGSDCGCGTDLTKFKPFYNDSHDFINITLLSEDEMIKLIGKDVEIDTHIKNYFIRKFRKAVNNIHVDYRRKIKGENLMFTHSSYDNNSTPDEIMNVLKNELGNIFLIFEKLNMITPEKRENFKQLLNNYIEYDVYKWNSDVMQIIRD